MDRIKKSFESTKAPEVQALPSNRTEQTIDNLTNANLETISKALADKDKAIAELQQKIADLKSELDVIVEVMMMNKLRANYSYQLEGKILNEDKNLTKIQGILTSNLRSRTSSDTPYMAFLRLETADFANHSLAECQRTKCQDCETPVVFRAKDPNAIQIGDCWLKPKLTKGQTVILEGQWAESNGNRPSFTCYSYQVLEGDSKHE